MKALQLLLISALLSTSGLHTQAYASEIRGPILYIGDSHSAQTFGKRIDLDLRALGQNLQVSSYGSCGSAPPWFYAGTWTTCGYFEHTNGSPFSFITHPTPLIESLLEHNHPAVTIIEQGANLIGYATSDAGLKHIAQVSERLAQSVAHAQSRCIWIGPPNGRNKIEPYFSRLYDTIRTAVAPYCELIDSRPFQHYPAHGGDGRHFDALGDPGKNTARCWADHVTAIVGQMLRGEHPDLPSIYAAQKDVCDVYLKAAGLL